ncbi:MAG: DUF2384 domain-containing protein [Oscillatoria sp. SIO1A7]|nr:DUF2384 domain-containing protein [Oscillatoria sp. SIO1A7]
MSPTQAGSGSESLVNIIYEILGLENAATQDPIDLPQEFQVINSIRQGFPIDSIRRIGQAYNIPESKVAALLGTSERTISRRQKQNKPLNATESDRIYRLARIFGRALQVFESADTSRSWLKRPNRALSGAIPLELLDTDAGTGQVDELLARIEYGIYS